MDQWVLTAIPTGTSANGQGDFTPFQPQVLGAQPVDDNVKMDYEERYLNLIRLSNLLTTRSDVFKAYVLVQGWRDAGTPSPQLVAERRAAFIVDRSRASSDNTAVTTYPLPSR
jgi:hypothetical protein